MFSYKVHTVQQRYNMNHLLAPLTSTVSVFKLLCTKGDTPSHNAINTKITSFVSLSDQCLLWKVVLNTNANVVDDNIFTAKLPTCWNLQNTTGLVTLYFKNTLTKRSYKASDPKHAFNMCTYCVIHLQCWEVEKWWLRQWDGMKREIRWFFSVQPHLQKKERKKLPS